MQAGAARLNNLHPMMAQIVWMVKNYVYPIRIMGSQVPGGLEIQKNPTSCRFKLLFFGGSQLILRVCYIYLRGNLA